MINITGIIAIIALFVILPKSFFSFIKHKDEMKIEKMKFQKEILELEVQKQNNQITLLEEENKKLDKVIEGK